VANNDRTVHPDLQRFAAKRMSAFVHAIDSSHVPMLSHPGFRARCHPQGRKSRSKSLTQTQATKV